MKKVVTIFLVLVLALSLIGSISAAYDEKLYPEPVSQDSFVPFSDETFVFTEMLNSNFIYNEAFVSDFDLIEGTMVMLLDESEDGRVLKNRVAEQMLDFYGITINEAAYEADYTDEEYFYYIPKGFDRAKHVIISIDFDGEYYNVVSDVTFTSHDEVVEPIKATSTFVKNENSTYGFNLISCVIE